MNDYTIDLHEMRINGHRISCIEYIYGQSFVLCADGSDAVIVSPADWKAIQQHMLANGYVLRSYENNSYISHAVNMVAVELATVESPLAYEDYF